MGQKGSRSAREVSAIVLLDDNFGSIVAAIAEGRTLFTNLRLSFQYLLIIHIPLVLTATFIPLAGFPVLYLPIHIVWIEAIIHPAPPASDCSLVCSGRSSSRSAWRSPRSSRSLTGEVSPAATTTLARWRWSCS
jgi:hypothetical protein